MRKIFLSFVAASVIGCAGLSVAAAAPGSNLLDALSSTDLLVQVKKGGGGGGKNWKGGSGWKGGQARHHRHGWRRWARGRACPGGFYFTCVPGGCFCVPY